MTDIIHIEHCATCGGALNARNPQQSYRGPDGTYTHNTDYCRQEGAAQKAARLWKISQPSTD